MSYSSLAGIIFLCVFFGLIIVSARSKLKLTSRSLREIPALSRIRRGIGLAVEAGQRLHLTLGHGGVVDVKGGSGLLGLSLLERTARSASISDHPPTATSGEATLALLSRDTLKSVSQLMNTESQYDPEAGQLSGLTSFSFAAGAMLVAGDPLVSMNLFAGHFGSEVGLIIEAAERNDSLTFGGSDDPGAQAILYAAAQQPLIGEELYAAGAYWQVNRYHIASVHAQDVMRWVLAVVILAGVMLKALGIL